MVYAKSDLSFFFQNWNKIQGFIGVSTAYFVHVVAQVQAELGIVGAIGEIGVAAGKSFATLAFTRRANETLMACDIFKAGVEKDNCPEVNLPLFHELLDFIRIPREDVSILPRSSLELSDTELVSLSAGAEGYRLFHVDGGHYLEAALSDLSVAACALAPGGVVLVDDLHNLRWPGVQEALHRYMLTRPPTRRLVPFLYTGRLFLTTSGTYAKMYRRAIKMIQPEVQTNRFHGSELLTTPALDIGIEEVLALYDQFPLLRQTVR